MTILPSTIAVERESKHRCAEGDEPALFPRWWRWSNRKRELILGPAVTRIKSEQPIVFFQLLCSKKLFTSTKIIYHHRNNPKLECEFLNISSTWFFLQLFNGERESV